MKLFGEDNPELEQALIEASKYIQETGGIPVVDEFVLDGDTVHGLNNQGHVIVSMPYSDFEGIRMHGS